jgi:ABC-type glycerol-3-phosphate transport system substrate-binding protein
MKRMIAATLMITLVSLGLLGCGGETKSTIKQETKITTPGGTTTITTERDVKKSGDNPPVARP